MFGEDIKGAGHPCDNPLPQVEGVAVTRSGGADIREGTRRLELHKQAHPVAEESCVEIGIYLRTLKRWRKAFGCDGNGKDRRNYRPRLVSYRLREEEHQRILLTCKQPE
jgi:hypothetical protein